MPDTPNQLILLRNDRNIVHLVLATLGYTLSLWLLYKLVLHHTNTVESIKRLGGIIIIIGVALRLSLIKETIIDIEKQRYRQGFGLGTWVFSKWRHLPSIEYISVFKQALSDGNHQYQINLWYQKSKRITAFECLDKEKAITITQTLAHNFQLDWLDATSPKKIWHKNAQID
ncbi:hypothetical protein [Sediminicola luteus]|uniref:DUF5673 domain-containing protein n=1 Tax=Sediminicola luteus TaxID=319238 RepID=A0A2A4G1T7_9FLAO|nr:hypothetical protein [Sediminicola luteus]PCE62939.1 hypothetical protein B7P33_16825 [Sediminicola luteus]